MHNGSLEDVVRFYDAGGRPRHPEIGDEEIALQLRRGLDLSEAEIEALVVFLRTLTNPATRTPTGLCEVPATVPSGLTPVTGVVE